MEHQISPDLFAKYAADPVAETDEPGPEDTEASAESADSSPAADASTNSDPASSEPAKAEDDYLGETIAKARAVLEQKEAAERTHREALKAAKEAEEQRAEVQRLKRLVKEDPFAFLDEAQIDPTEFVKRAIARSEGREYKEPSAPAGDAKMLSALQQQIQQLQQQIQQDRDLAFQTQVRGFLYDNDEKFPLLLATDNPIAELERYWADTLRTTGRSLSLEEAAEMAERDAEKRAAKTLSAYEKKKERQNSSAPAQAETKKPRAPIGAKPLNNSMAPSAPGVDDLPVDPQLRLAALMKARFG